MRHQVMADLLEGAGFEAEAAVLRQPPVWLWDNEESYSDWALYFIQTDLPPEVIEKFMLIHDRSGRIVGRGDLIEWMNYEPTSLVGAVYGPRVDEVLATDFGEHTHRILSDCLAALEKDVARYADMIAGDPNNRNPGWRAGQRMSIERRDKMAKALSNLVDQRS